MSLDHFGGKSKPALSGLMLDDTIEIPTQQDASAVARDHVEAFHKRHPEAAATVQRLPEEDHVLAEEIIAAPKTDISNVDAVRLYRVAREILDRKRERGDQAALLLDA